MRRHAGTVMSCPAGSGTRSSRPSYGDQTSEPWSSATSKYPWSSHASVVVACSSVPPSTFTRTYLPVGCHRLQWNRPSSVCRPRWLWCLGWSCRRHWWHHLQACCLQCSRWSLPGSRMPRPKRSPRPGACGESFGSSHASSKTLFELRPVEIHATAILIIRTGTSTQLDAQILPS